MPKTSKTKSTKQRVRAGKLSTTKTKLTGNQMTKVKGGFTGGVRVALGDVVGDGFISGLVKKER